MKLVLSFIGLLSGCMNVLLEFVGSPENLERNQELEIPKKKKNKNNSPLGVIQVSFVIFAVCGCYYLIFQGKLFSSHNHSVLKVQLS